MLELLIKGGWSMLAIVICSIITVAVVLERWLTLRSVDVDSEALLQKALREAGLARHYSVRSAGVGALPGAPAARGMIEAARERGIDLTAHRARRLTPEMAREAEMVIALDEVVEEENKAAVASDEIIEALDLQSETGDLMVHQEPGVKAVFGDPLASRSHFLQTPGGGKVFCIFHKREAHP